MTVLQNILMGIVGIIAGSAIILIILADVMLVIANIVRRIPFKRKPRNAVMRWFWEMEK
jgi:hypothetical protein